MHKGYYNLSGFNGVIIFAFGVTYAVGIHRPVTPAHYQKIIIALINYFLDVIELINIRCRKQLHPGRNMLQVQNISDSVLTLLK